LTTLREQSVEPQMLGVTVKRLAIALMKTAHMEKTGDTIDGT